MHLGGQRIFHFLPFPTSRAQGSKGSCMTASTKRMPKYIQHLELTRKGSQRQFWSSISTWKPKMGPAALPSSRLWEQLFSRAGDIVDSTFKKKSLKGTIVFGSANRTACQIHSEMKVMFYVFMAFCFVLLLPFRKSFPQNCWQRSKINYVYPGESREKDGNTTLSQLIRLLPEIHTQEVNIWIVICKWSDSKGMLGVGW